MDGVPQVERPETHLVLDNRQQVLVKAHQRALDLGYQRGELAMARGRLDGDESPNDGFRREPVHLRIEGPGALVDVAGVAVVRIDDLDLLDELVLTVAGTLLLYRFLRRRRGGLT